MRVSLSCRAAARANTKKDKNTNNYKTKIIRRVGVRAPRDVTGLAVFGGGVRAHATRPRGHRKEFLLL
jgi:hypothetical protein